MSSTSEFLESGEVARLIPVIADSRREQRVVSVFLATMSAVPGFAQVLLSSLGVRLGKRSVIDTFTEVVLKSQKDTSDRPDGLIVVSSGQRVWRALVEAKIGTSRLDEDQVQRYLQLARENEIDAVITISNQFVVRPTHNPVKVPKGLKKKVDIFHWSWKTVLTEALLLQTRGDINDPDQAFLLREFIRFLSHGSIGITGFDSMPKEWKDLVTLVKSGGTISRSSREAESVVFAWHQETRDLALRMSQHLAVDVALKLARLHASDEDQHRKDSVAVFSSDRKLEAEYSIPNAASPLQVVADLTSQTIRVGMEIGAPLDRKRSAARVNWLLRQLKSADDSRLFVRIVWPSRAPDTVCRLAELRDNADLVLSGAALPPKSFEVFLLNDDGRRFAGRKTFIEDLERAVPDFYENVGQNLERWVPKPPKPVSTEKVTAEAKETAQATLEKDQVHPTIEPSRLSAGNQHSALLEIPRFLCRKASDEEEGRGTSTGETDPTVQPSG